MKEEELIFLRYQSGDIIHFCQGKKPQEARAVEAFHAGKVAAGSARATMVEPYLRGRSNRRAAAVMLIFEQTRENREEICRRSFASMRPERLKPIRLDLLVQVAPFEADRLCGLRDIPVELFQFPRDEGLLEIALGLLEGVGHQA